MQQEQGQVYITLDKNIVSSQAEEIKSELKQAIAPETQSLVLDLDQVEQVDSIGMGILIATYNSLRKENKAFKLVNVSENVYDLLQVMRLNQHFEIQTKSAGE